MGKKIEIWTDGSANNNPKQGQSNKGGYGIVFINGQVKQYCGGSYIHTTSARMEILAIIRALQKCIAGDNITVYSDNEYAVNTLQKGWVFKWSLTNFNRRKNGDLWRQFLHEYNRLQRKVTLKWVKGHSDHEYNILADKLARRGANREQQLIDLIK